MISSPPLAIILASKRVLPRRRPVLPAAICLSALNTLVARGSSRTHHGNWCLKSITFFFFFLQLYTVILRAKGAEACSHVVPK